MVLSTNYVLSIFFTFVAAIIFIFIPSRYGEKIKRQWEGYVNYFGVMLLIYMICVSFVMFTFSKV